MRRRVVEIAAAGAAVAAALALRGGDPGGEPPSALPFDGRSPVVAETGDVRVLVELQRPSLGERVLTERLAADAQRAYVRSLRREAEALQSALAARGVRLRDVVPYERVWNGFAATVSTEDLPRVQTLGVRAQPVRRFYPAATAAQPAPASRVRAARPSGPPRAALLDSGVDLRHPVLRGRVVPGYDAVERDRDPSPGRASGGRRDLHGTQSAGILLDSLGARDRIIAVRVAGLQRGAESGAPEEGATTDQVLDGLEHAVDPDGDGDSGDAPPVALVGVSSPYAGFARAPEAEAAGAASALGMLVVAPAGNEGESGGRFGTIGSPAAADAALAVGALERTSGAPGLARVRIGLAAEGGREVVEGWLLGGEGVPRRAQATGLDGPSQADPRARDRAAGGELLQYFGVDARPRAGGAVVFVPARARGRTGGPAAPPPAAVAAAADAAGAAAVVICDPEGDRLRAVPRSAGGRTPVIGLSGEAARRALELTARGDALAFVSAAERSGSGGDGPRLAPSSSRGPTYELRRKPDVTAPGTATAPLPGAGSAFASGTSVAAARAAGEAAKLARVRPHWSASEVRAALVAAAAPANGEAGLVDARRAAAVPLLPEPATLTLARGGVVAVRNTGRRPLAVQAKADLRGVTAAPRSFRLGPGRTRRVVLRGHPGAVERQGALRLRAGGRELRIGLLLRGRRGAPATLGRLRLIREGRGVRGVRFAAGRVRRDGDRYALAVEPVGRLVLRLVPEGDGEATELTPPGGALDLLPGEYAYTLTSETLRELPSGRYRFVARARAPGAGARRVTRRSRAFGIR